MLFRRPGVSCHVPCIVPGPILHSRCPFRSPRLTAVYPLAPVRLASALNALPPLHMIFHLEQDGVTGSVSSLCQLTVYVVWTGTDSKGNYFTSFSKRLSMYAGEVRAHDSAFESHFGGGVCHSLGILTLA